jgi:hypothetical protein|tara:strand:+ start:251 stop:442 length:192 start_codon:yes stop_codon:yes gene_type:complete
MNIICFVQQQYGEYCGGGAIHPSSYVAETIQVATHATTFRVTLRHTYKGASKHVALAVLEVMS